MAKTTVASHHVNEHKKDNIEQETCRKLEYQLFKKLEQAYTVTKLSNGNGFVNGKDLEGVIWLLHDLIASARAIHQRLIDSSKIVPDTVLKAAKKSSQKARKILDEWID